MNTQKSGSRCNYCRKDVVRSFAIRCAECEDFTLCSDCFSAGVELSPHKNSHKYKVSDCLEFPLFVKDWTVSEELALMEGTCLVKKFEIVVNHFLFSQQALSDTVWATGRPSPIF